MTKENIKVAIADDQEIFRDGLNLVLGKAEWITVVGEAENGQQLLEVVEQARPNVVLTDVVMPVLDGIEATKRIIEAFPEVKVIGLSMFGEETMIMDMLDAGATGYLLKNADKEEIYRAIEYVNRGECFYCKAASQQLVRMIGRERKRIHEVAVQLSDKEKQIIRGICEEMSNEQIANELYMSKRTIDGYRSRILEKLGVKSSIGVVKYAIKAGIYKL